MSDPRILTLATTLEARRPSSSSEKCTICLMLLTDTPAGLSKAEMESVITKVCGDKHFFHRICLESWFRSATPHLNTCPVDRALCFGSMCVNQPATDNVEYSDFLGHDPDTHDHANGFLGQLPTHFAEGTEVVFPDNFLKGLEDMEVLDHNAVKPRPDQNDPVANTIARGMYPLPRVRPFSAEADPEAQQDFLDGAADLVGFFDNEEPEANLKTHQGFFDGAANLVGFFKDEERDIDHEKQDDTEDESEDAFFTGRFTRPSGN
jgi:hypothetical protein